MYTIEQLEKFWELYLRGHQKAETMTKVIDLFKDFLKRHNITQLSIEELGEKQKEFLREYKTSPELNVAIYTTAYSAFQSTVWLDDILERVKSDEEYQRKKAKFIEDSKFVPDNPKNAEDQIIKYFTKEQKILKYKDFLNQ